MEATVRIRRDGGGGVVRSTAGPLMGPLKLSLGGGVVDRSMAGPLTVPLKLDLGGGGGSSSSSLERCVRSTTSRCAAEER